MLIKVSEVITPDGSTIGIGRGTDPKGRTVWFGGDWRPMVGLAQAVAEQGEVEASVDSWQLITNMSLICETLDGHDFKAEDIADGVVGGGAAHVMAIYCERCDLPGGPEDIE